MSGITGNFVAMMAQAWHRITLPSKDEGPLASMLAPMDAAGEDIANTLQFDMEPSDFDRALEELASKANKR